MRISYYTKFFVVITIYNSTVFQDAIMYLPLLISDSFSLICFHKSYFKENSILTLEWKGERERFCWQIDSLPAITVLMDCIVYALLHKAKAFFFLILKSETGKISVWIEIKIVFLQSVFQHFDTHAYCIPLQLSSYFVHMNCGGDNSLVRRASSLLVCSSGSWRRPRVPSCPPSMGTSFHVFSMSQNIKSVSSETNCFTCQLPISLSRWELQQIVHGPTTEADM